MSQEQSKRESDQRGAAFHEAGHIVVAWSLGLAVGGAEIAIGGDDAKGTAEVQTPDHLDLLDQLAVCAAGLEAQELFEAPTHDIGGVGDYGQMWNLLEDVEEEDRRSLIDKGHARASELVSAHRETVERIAAALLQKKRLDADEVARLLAN
ncbi:hypothetical protein ACMA5K_27125 [Bradyrhizobium diazoefficiens]|uniref:Peptidase M41 domain-containing protein n=1 Tax=Bradyrhizobium diazoefficiens TaxID=1355477 RepID=A0A810A0D9_9BRAD|nr:hypothetical protein [Bradyrhizobium diazoefficiens]QLD44381.1 hypothetical protein HUW42_26820 [Bradyrhizobium diazoefficiens]WLA70683.1 hypothetical protein QIH77_27725 [Bradyrhizobium diazoefficiens]BBZ94535.1 hypothetical protein F07S3_43680 [Bradyrhizobium diazoefficiens]BCA12217.1 hypothetical protein BDHF08_40640 [Bradyrhizobium diazoefficiens]BCE21491.1 hypothetical protein XF1B_41720 [Bradyrhizobium diazoefficiens]